ncbi:hypothetical protein G9C98_003191 [Cotesia typhae]|uniref:Uncharacterized protein n=1 Tax=Cotesia typhae TaxID=2053667 RepID=A0A8J5VAB4_9HYME|nr:hypothetical protein G9C98_003191 [Cotesia typhae]
MDVSLLSYFQYAIPVGIVLIFAVLVFAFGFKNAEQPPFAQLSAVSDVDRKQANKKRNKIKEKRSTNEKANEKASPVKKSLPAKTESSKKSVAKNDEVEGKLKERKHEDNTSVVAKKDKTQVTNKSGKENKVEQVKNKKNMKNLILEKPIDFDDGDWEQAYSRKDKKKKKEEESPKKIKKSKKSELVTDDKNIESEKVEIKDKVAKETENKELKEKVQKDVVLEPIDDIIEVQEEEVESIEDKKAEKNNVIEKEKEDKKSAKAKKNKKSNDSENTSVSNVTSVEIKSEKIIEKKVEDAFPKKTDQVETFNKVEQVSEKGGAVFDELGDTWTEAKPQKKSKKKARKDN